jgi:hypothetical protein
VAFGEGADAHGMRGAVTRSVPGALPNGHAIRKRGSIIKPLKLLRKSRLSISSSAFTIRDARLKSGKPFEN